MFQTKQLARTTCRDLKTSCIHVMKKILSNELAVRYSWYGAKKKEKFVALQICTVIMCKYNDFKNNVLYY